tara:strand:+ start:1954 stop:2385 length:432 start_codon:yes stop_codon:yes gene_type:complete
MATEKQTAKAKKQVEQAERRARALELRAAGLTYEIIARQLGYSSRSVAHRDIQGALKEMVERPAKELLSEELNRLDRLMAGMWSEARKGDDRKAHSVLKILDMRAKYLGLYAPDRIEAEVRIDDPAQLAASIAAIAEGLSRTD